MTSPSSDSATSSLDRSDFDRKVYAVVGLIPTGKVMTYGDVAAQIPAPRGIDPLAYRRVRARWVGYALSRCPEDLPWHRVVNAHGRASPRPSGGHALQIALLKQEDTPFLQPEKVDLSAARWQPRVEDLPDPLRR